MRFSFVSALGAVQRARCRMNDRIRTGIPTGESDGLPCGLIGVARPFSRLFQFRGHFIAAYEFERDEVAPRTCYRDHEKVHPLDRSAAQSDPARGLIPSAIMERFFAVGDIHGCADRLKALLARLEVDWKTDRVIFLGDYVDRGPASSEVLDILVGLQQRHGDRVIFLLGNHELMFRRYLAGEDSGIFLVSGGAWTVASYRNHGSGLDIPPDHLAFLEGLRPYYETDRYIFVHAGLRPGLPMSQQSLEDFLWIRGPFLESTYDWGKRIIFGHTPFANPLIQANKLGIDTGAVYGGRLTAVVLPEVDFVMA